MRAAALCALAMGLGCRASGPVAPRGGVGVRVTIDQPTDGGAGLARVDDRRWLDVPASGTLELTGVAAELQLDSVVIEAMADPGALRVLGCALLDHVDALASGWLLGREVAIVTARGAEVSGTVVEIGPPVWVVALPDGDVEVAEHDVMPVIPIGGSAPTPGTEVRVETATGTGTGELRSRLVEHLVVNGGGLRQAVRFDAIARLRVPELVATPTLRCRVQTSRPGRQAVRLAYQTTAARWEVGYQIGAVDDATTEVALVPRYQVDLAGLRGADAAEAEVSLRVDGAGDDEAPVTVWTGAVALAGEAVTVVGAPSKRPARVRRRYRGADVDGGERADDDLRWGREFTAVVWRELVFERAPTDVPGPLRVALADDGAAGARRWLAGELPVAPDGGAKLVRVPLDVDPRLVGFRQRLFHGDDGLLADEVRLSVANRGDRPVRVILEEPLRALGRPTVRFAAPAVGTLSASYWQLEVEVAPGAVERAAVLLQYPER